MESFRHPLRSLKNSFAKWERLQDPTWNTLNNSAAKGVINGFENWAVKTYHGKSTLISLRPYIWSLSVEIRSKCFDYNFLGDMLIYKSCALPFQIEIVITSEGAQRSIEVFNITEKSRYEWPGPARPETLLRGLGISQQPLGRLTCTTKRG